MEKYEIETAIDPSRLKTYMADGLKFILTTNTAFDNIYLFELFESDNTFTIEQKVICFRNGKPYLESKEVVESDSSIHYIYPFRDKLGDFVGSSLQALLSGTLQENSNLFATLNSEKTLDWIFDCFLEIVKSVRDRGNQLLTVKERNRIINEGIFNISTNFMEIETIEKSSRSKEKRPRVKAILEFIADYTVIDIETTGLVPEEDGITELAAMRIRNHEIDATFEILLNPGKPIPQQVIDLTHITNEMVSNQPSLEEVYDIFKEFIGDDVLVGHNIVWFDGPFINTKMPYSPITNKMIDTMWIARKLIKDEVRNLKLSSICEALGVHNQHAHRALSDIEATYRCYERLADYAKEQGKSIESVRYKNWKASDIKPELEVQTTNSLDGKVFVITGELGNLDRKAAFQMIVNRGGIVKDGITKRTDYLVYGEHDGYTTKYKKAVEMQKQGHNIEIISREAFFALIEYNEG